ncbi:MAG TPA: general secretion pathway protein GspB [Ideonella sp.]|uniref:general secretion pathway protein GspB n=1 Tax=Ideonella sp. TaxID=1929293 RepID=UPI002CED5406|nr:general secretion pathway protein GspB [Ideonella sp.]HSI48825.1 general secretion pathway protein GspB [Ideonella sp.]
MSYILDALRRAEADRERERGQVPGLHTQTLPGSEPTRAASPRRWLPWAGGGLLLLAGVGAGSWWTQREPATPLPAPAPQVAAQTEAPVISPAPVPVPVPTAPPAAQPVVSVPAPAASSIYLPQTPPAVAAKPRTVAPEPAPAPPPAVAATPAPAPAAAEGRPPLVSELPESLRRELPKLAISGSVYSDDPASRFLIVNGEVLHEGAKLGADLVLEQIRPHELVLRFKGQRYRQPV